MSFMRVVVETNQAGATVARLIKATTGDKKGSIARIANFLRGIAGGSYRGTVEVCTTAVKATATLTMTGNPSDAETFVICGTTFTMRTSGASGNEANIGATITLTAAAIAAAVNASATTKVTGSVVATSALGVVTFTAKVPGAIGNGLVLTESMTTTTRVDFAGGSDGTLKSLSAGGAAA